MTALLLLLAGLLAVLTPGARGLAECSQGKNCRLPACFCPTFTHPLFDTDELPQLVYFGFDDALTGVLDKFYRDLFVKGPKNPNGCPISMSLYIENKYTDYGLVHANYEAGMEIACHSFTHTSIKTAKKLYKEAKKQKHTLSTRGDLPLTEVVGWRSPSLITAGDKQPTVLSQLGYTYDISLSYTPWPHDAPFAWPYTLDFGYPYHCAVPPCPGKNSSHPGFWEVPVNSLYDKFSKRPCTYVDSCRPKNETEAFSYLWDNFAKAYNGNRAPFGLNMHAAWFMTKHNFAATRLFMEYLITLGDVYIVSVEHVLQWMKHPISKFQLKGDPTFGCQKSWGPRRDPTLRLDQTAQRGQHGALVHPTAQRGQHGALVHPTAQRGGESVVNMGP